MIVNIILLLTVLFILALILAPVYYYVKRDKYADEPESEDDV